MNYSRYFFNHGRAMGIFFIVVGLPEPMPWKENTGPEQSRSFPVQATRRIHRLFSHVTFPYECSVVQLR